MSNNFFGLKIEEYDQTMEGIERFEMRFEGVYFLFNGNYRVIPILRRQINKFYNEFKKNPRGT